MKKRWLSLGLTAALSLTLLAGCGGNSGQTSNNTAADTSDTQAVEDTADTAADEGNVEASDTASASGGSVYYLNFKPEADQAWQDLAATYTEQTGVTVKVVTAASGTYSDTLTAEMAKSDAPTL